MADVPCLRRLATLRVRRSALFVIAILATMSVVLGGRVSPAHAVNGASSTCDAFTISIIGFDITQFPEPGWVWVDPNQKLKSVSGKVEESFVTHTDFPAVHDSHDQNTHLTPDPGYEDLISDVNDPGEIEMEWEIGTFPDETSGDPAERTYPRWAWPSAGDRMWMDGNWIFDCGHPTEVGGVNHYHSEIHPARAVASMRQQSHPLPGTGTTPVPVTATDLYIHGRAGFVGDDLECGQEIILGAGSCGVSSYPHRGTPIDSDYDFNICLPPKPSPSATLATSMENGPGNTIATDPVLTPQASAGPCIDPQFGPMQVHVHVPLAGTGVSMDDTLARKIYAGWAQPVPGMKHVVMTLKLIDLHEDQDLDPTDCECSFFWLNVDRSPDEWFRLTPFQIPTDDDSGFGCFQHTNTLNDWDDDGGCGNGNLNFNGPTFDFVLAAGQDFTLRSVAYDQDCLDDLFGFHDLLLGALALAGCYIPPENGDNDQYNAVDVSNLTSGSNVKVSNPGGEFDMYFDVSVTDLDTTPPVAAPTQAPAANGAGWNNSDVTVSWHWTDEAGGSGIDNANCTTSTTSTGEGNPITLTATCEDLAGNEGHASYDVKVDMTPPTVNVTGVTDGGQYVFGAEPTPGCTTTDSLSGVKTLATVSIATPPGGVGQFTATCSGAVDVADNHAADSVVHYTVVYGFGGFLSPLPLETLKQSGSTIAIKFRFTNAAGTPISSSISAALAAAGKVEVILAGPAGFSQTQVCTWDSGSLFFKCDMKTPKGLLTGPSNPYTLTAYEDVGTGFVVAPPVGTAVNPETVFFK
jgi:hypothetical protein